MVKHRPLPQEAVRLVLPAMRERAPAPETALEECGKRTPDRRPQEAVRLALPAMRERAPAPETALEECGKRAPDRRPGEAVRRASA